MALKRHAKKPEVVAVIKIQDTYAEVEAYVRRNLERQVTTGKAALAKFVADVQGSTLYNAVERLTWLQDPSIEMQVGALACEVLSVQEGEDGQLELRLRYMVENQTRAMLTNQYRGGSSSAYHNATDVAKREGASRFIDSYKWSLREFATARAFEIDL